MPTLADLRNDITFHRTSAVTVSLVVQSLNISSGFPGKCFVFDDP